ncbi:50S ribosomal protein L11 methyltransferase [Aliiglaciecola sp. 2_MG-2023]|uniref:50S ribosomal protein L11 methyltransferase n=1 Tax=unclassified Aliiglaciecola TaxID=2593648 RepID=UPI0026E2219E|nr:MULTISPECIES: 50S ribosomal protein L11 methyltransferase [unclassified Aliiglaciecola]MDO6711138.1 50S ribosomal protein L11 methyltransferase [Aliiglaciecola sp. 2_MG-2023]MDO6752052.1 50S ribosomal protein L11 methyltransferase [Aliiglaciecola sp. 1_MG-2023]
MPWIQLIIDTHAENAEQIGDMLSANGAQAVTFTDAKDTPMYEPKPGEVILWPDTQVIGLYDAEFDMQRVVSQLEKSKILGKGFSHKLDQLEDKDWEREWMDNFHPIQFGKRLWICPSWRDIPDPTAVNVMLDPGLAFGTGTHPTTSLCLQWLDALTLEGKTVVDFGCGSGILGIAALKLGAESVVGIDIDPQALLASKDNAGRNDVADKISVFLPKDQPDLQADIVLANILAGPLRELREVITNYCKSGGLLVLSGILANQAEEIDQLYSADFDMEPIAIEGDWARVSGKKK